MNDSEKITALLEHFSLKATEFASEIGLNNVQNVYDIQRGKSGISKDVANRIVARYDCINKNWLISDDENMLNDKTLFRLVPLINLDAVGGFKINETTPDEPQYTIGMIPFTDAQKDDICVPVSGDSMMPTCPSGSIVLIREVKAWNEYFGFGNIFVLVLKDGRRILKEVNKCAENPSENILCVSHNKNVPDEPLPKSLIGGVWKVIKILTDKGY